MRSNASFFLDVSGRVRAMALIEASERAALTPIKSERLHALAYLADVLSPVWGLEPFDRVALKTDQPPFFATFQSALDELVIQGMIEVSNFSYERVAASGALTFNASYALRHSDPFVRSVLQFMYDDELFGQTIEFFATLAVALSRLPDDEIASAASRDATWENIDIAPEYLLEITGPLGQEIQTPTTNTIRFFDAHAAGGVRLGRASHLRLYASYLGERLKAA